MVQNNGFRVPPNVVQEEDQIRASASHSAGRVQSLEANGFVRGPDFDLTITWDNNTKCATRAGYPTVHLHSRIRVSFRGDGGREPPREQGKMWKHLLGRR